ncbi:MAG: hypothetical protein ACO3TI_06105 [Aquiluna sp.]
MSETQTSSRKKNDWERLGCELLSMLYKRPDETGIAELRFSSGPDHIHYEIQIFKLQSGVSDVALYTLSFDSKERSEGGDFEALNKSQKTLVLESRRLWEQLEGKNNEH